MRNGGHFVPASMCLNNHMVSFLSLKFILEPEKDSPRIKSFHIASICIMRDILYSALKNWINVPVTARMSFTAAFMRIYTTFSYLLTFLWCFVPRIALELRTVNLLQRISILSDVHLQLRISCQTLSGFAAGRPCIVWNLRLTINIRSGVQHM